MTQTLAERFEKKTETDPATGCRLWQGATSGGRGIMCIAGRSRLASHIAVELATGAAPPRGAWVLPTCGNKNCVAADHLSVDAHGASKPRRKVPLQDRLQNSTVDPVSGCHLFNGSISSTGYGRIYSNRKWRAAHRIAYELANGLIPDGMVVRHRCDVPRCVNPDHLQLGTHLDNQRDRAERGRTDRGRHLLPQMTKRDRAVMLASCEAGFRRYAVRHGWALSASGFAQALRTALRERASENA